jgi:hypothetical protein
MRREVTYESWGDDFEQEAYTELRDHIERMLDAVEKFAEAQKEYDHAFDLMGHDPFTHHDMNRLRRSFASVQSYLFRVQDKSSASPDYALGRWVEQCIRRLEARLEEWEMILEYYSQ